MCDYKKISKKYNEEIVANLKKWININSVYDEKTANEKMPFGKGVHDALNFIASLAEQKGFNVDRCDGYCVEISYGTGDIIGIYAHADVVPVSGDWKHEPFSGEIEDGKMYGRGTSDDKGPALAAFYALCVLKDNGLINGYQVRLVVGGNEESGSKCLEYYFNVLKKTYPKYGFTPDGDFPLIYGEKGIANYKVTKNVSFKNVKEIKGGVVANSVIDKAYAVITSDFRIEESAKLYFKTINCGYSLKQLSDSEYRLDVNGKAAHGSLPHEGINACLVLMRFLANYFDDKTIDEVPYCYLDADGTNLNLYYETKLLHSTTYNVGLLSYIDNKLEYVVNFRYPENVSVSQVIKNLNAMNIGNHELLSESAPLLIDPNSSMVQTLLKVYQEETEDYDSEIMTIGGGTYAKESKNTLAFGSHFPNRDDRIHNSNETITLTDLTSSIAIYAHAINSLGKL